MLKLGYNKNRLGAENRRLKRIKMGKKVRKEEERHVEKG